MLNIAIGAGGGPKIRSLFVVVTKDSVLYPGLHLGPTFDHFCEKAIYLLRTYKNLLLQNPKYPKP